MGRILSSMHRQNCVFVKLHARHNVDVVDFSGVAMRWWRAASCSTGTGWSAAGGDFTLLCQLPSSPQTAYGRLQFLHAATLSLSVCLLQSWPQSTAASCLAASVRRHNTGDKGAQLSSLRLVHSRETSAQGVPFDSITRSFEAHLQQASER